jgi:hypothetical protein
MPKVALYSQFAGSFYSAAVDPAIDSDTDTDTGTGTGIDIDID